MRTPTLALAVLGLTGCSSGIDGVWTMNIPYTTADACVDSVSHNFTGATEIAEEATDDDGWTTTESDEQSDQLIFLQIESTGKDSAVMVIGPEVWVGTELSKGLWSFSWEGSEDSSLTEAHETGYEYTETVLAQSSDTLQLAFDAGIGGGTWTMSSTSEQAWAEADGWSEELGFRTGRIPSDLWLEREPSGGGPGGGTSGPTPPELEPATNERDVADCDSDTCRLQVTSECASEMDVTLQQTDYDAEEVFDYLRNAGRPHGA